MTDIAKPSTNAADDGTIAGVFRTILGKFLQNVDDMLPAKVISFNRTTGIATVQPQIFIVSTENQNIARAPVASVPVFQIGGGGFLLSFPIKKGDLGWIKANDRDISLFRQAFSVAPPNTARKHSFEDAVFFPDAMRGWTINGEDAGNVVLQTLDGTQRVAISPTTVKITSINQIILDAPLTTITGNLASGTNTGHYSHFAGGIIAQLDVIGGGISLDTHHHTGVQTGGGTTGGPV